MEHCAQIRSEQREAHRQGHNVQSGGCGPFGMIAQTTSRGYGSLAWLVVVGEVKKSGRHQLVENFGCEGEGESEHSSDSVRESESTCDYEVAVEAQKLCKQC